MNLSRRSFLSHGSIVTGGIVGFGCRIPQILAAATGSGKSHTDQKLVVIFLNGGNDGLNTVIPVNDPLYRKHRQLTRIKASDAIRIDENVSLHPSMRGLAEVWENNRLAIVQGVGYPNQSRSHFISRAAWHAGAPGASTNTSDGWLGRSLDDRQSATDDPLAFSFGSSDTPVALRGRSTRTAISPNLSNAEARKVRELLAGISSAQVRQQSPHGFVSRANADAVNALDQLLTTDAMDENDFPKTKLGQQLSQASWLIRSCNPASVYFLQQNGYDTHSGQPPNHASLLRELSDALASFDRTIASDGLSSNVTVMVFSEFGRRVAENGSDGTDHGKAGPVLILGGGYQPGLHGEPVDLQNLSDGDLRVTTDFRNVYATVLEHSLGIDPKDVLPRNFEPIAKLVCR